MRKYFGNWGWEGIPEVEVRHGLKVNLKKQRYMSHVKRFKNSK